LLREKGAKKSAKGAFADGKNAGRRDNQPAIPIHRAAEQGDLESLKKHIASGADINSQDGRDGETPLHRAITRGQTAAARLLIEGGCDLNIGRKKDGDTPLDMAEGRGRTDGNCRISA
jgi:ankyrin repeat protein